MLLAVPALLIARYAFDQLNDLDQAGRELDAKNRRLQLVPGQVMEERMDERKAIAAALHDDVIQTLHFLTLHAQVIREDLRAGRLLQLEEDVPALLSASRHAADLTRQVVGELRTSPLGLGGIEPTLIGLRSMLIQQFNGSIEVAVDPAARQLSELCQVFLYQVAREAATNAAKHSMGNRVEVRVWVEAGYGRVRVSDDGVGFDPAGVDTRGHFGLLLLEERAQIAGSTVEIASSLGNGCVVEGRVPVDATAPVLQDPGP